MKLCVCYYPEHWPESQWASDARRMVELGIGLVRIGEFAWGRLEPEPGRYDFAWLDRAIDTLAAAGLKVVLGTPTAAPPKWLVDRHLDILPVGSDGRVKQFGSRRHYCFSSESYFNESHRIVTAVAQRYGQHPAIIAWQIDNEYGCHDTVMSYSSSVVRRFRLWLQSRYGDIEALNAAWNAVFWSSEYRSFDEIEAPIGTVTDPLPTHRLDYRRFISDEVVRYNRMQAEVLRTHSPGRDVTHNFMAFFAEFDHYDMAPDLDLASWDSYPLGHSGINSILTEAEKLRWARTGHPDVPAFHHDLYRGLCGGRFWVMEQQAGPVNWAHWNPIPLPGMVRLWTWEAFAHGAEVVSYFRWRQCPFGQEQMHSGLNTPDDRIDTGGREVAQVARELLTLAGDHSSRRAPVALIFDYLSCWQATILPHGADFNYFALYFRYYSALRQLGLDVDIVSSHASLEGYRLILLPAQIHVSSALVEALERARTAGGQIVIGARSGSKSKNLTIEEGLPPGPLRRLLPIRINSVESLPPDLNESVVWEGKEQCMRHWREQVEVLGDAVVAARFADGSPAIIDGEGVRYLAGWPADDFLCHLLADSARLTGLAPQDLGESLRLRRRGNLCFAFNVGPGCVALPALPKGTTLLLGQAELKPGELAIWQHNTSDEREAP